MATSALLREPRHTSSPATATRTGDPAVQAAWAARPVRDRLAILRRTRQLLATDTAALARAIAPHLQRTPADTVAVEILPLLAACRFLEREAASILRTRTLGHAGRPLWLSGLACEIERIPLGTVLVIGPANYPLFLPGVQVLGALAAGNAVQWKPGTGGRPVALLVARALLAAGLPDGLLTVTAEDTAAAQTAIAHGGPGGVPVDKIILTGSVASGRAVLHQAADHLIPVVAELSGADAVIVLPSADPAAVAEAIAFGLRLNGSATCMAPRRLLLVDATPAHRRALLAALTQHLAQLSPTPLDPATAARLRTLLSAARAAGAGLLSGGWADDGTSLLPTVLTGITPDMAIAQADLFAPVLSLIDVTGEAGVLAAQRACPYALTASIFGNEQHATALARKLRVGTVLVNDLIIATADPRLPFGGRAQSGFGSTRGAEGLLEMTAPRVLAIQRRGSPYRFQPTGALHIGLFAGLAALLYAGALGDRARGLRSLVTAGRALRDAAAPPTSTKPRKPQE